MNTFTVDKTALEKIKNDISAYNYSHPIVVLADRTDPQRLDIDQVLAKSIVESKEKRDEFVVMLRENQRNDEDRQPFYLTPIPYDGNDIKPEDRMTIDGVIFFMDSFLQKMLKDYCLSYENGRYVLRSDNHVAYRFCDITQLHGNTS